MLQETNGPQYYSESGASVSVESHSSSPLPNSLVSDQEQADSLNRVSKCSSNGRATTMWGWSGRACCYQRPP